MYRNLLLAELDDAALARIRPNLEDVKLEFKQRLYDQDQTVTELYFPNTAVASIINELADGTVVETGTIGYEGVTGVPAGLVGGQSPSLVICQIPGSAVGLPVSALVAELRRGGSPLVDAIFRYLNFAMAMLAQGSACNRAHPVEARLARWLLMSHDRVDSDDFPLTQEFIAQMLGVQRPTVNIAAATLQRAGFIRYTRGRIAVVDRRGLEASACDCYPFLAEHLERTIGRGIRRT
jgi:CRP-like cAMP-binding protein